MRSSTPSRSPAEVDEDAILIYPEDLDHGLDAYIEAGRDAADVGDDLTPAR